MEVFNVEEGSNNKKILIIDDEEDILKLLSTVLRREGLGNIYTAKDAASGYAMFEKVRPDIILLDIMLPDGDGYDICKKIRAVSCVPILFMSAKTEEIDRVLGFALGGDDYITKPFSPKEVAYRVKVNLKRTYQKDKQNQENRYERGLFTIDEKKVEVRKNGEVVELKAKEYNMLVYLAKHPNQILSKEQICRNVWGEDYIGFDNTIMVHIRRLREKIEDDPSNPKHIINIKGLGYKFVIGDE